MDAALLAQAGATHRRAPKLSFPSARVRSVLRSADHHSSIESGARGPSRPAGRIGRVRMRVALVAVPGAVAVTVHRDALA